MNNQLYVENACRDIDINNCVHTPLLSHKLTLCTWWCYMLCSPFVILVCRIYCEFRIFINFQTKMQTFLLMEKREHVLNKYKKCLSCMHLAIGPEPSPGSKGYFVCFVHTNLFQAFIFKELNCTRAPTALLGSIPGVWFVEPLNNIYAYVFWQIFKNWAPYQAPHKN